MFFDVAPDIASAANEWAIGVNTLIGAMDAMMVVVEAIASLLASLIGGVSLCRLRTVLDVLADALNFRHQLL